MSKILILTTWPVQKPEGSGMTTYFRALRKGFQKSGFEVILWNPDITSGNYFTHTLKRIAANFRLNSFIQSQDINLVLKLDYDGFLLPKKWKVPQAATPRGIFADIAPTERGLYRLFLHLQA